MAGAEKYLRPDVIRQVARLDLRAKFIVEGFLSGLHASPYHGFSVEFSEHRKYAPGDDLKDLDWNVYAKTDKYYLRKYQAETNLTGYLVLDLSASMDYTWKGDLTKFDYCVCLAAALGYMMIRQQDPVGLITFDTKMRANLAPKSRRSHLATMLGVLAGLKPTGATDVAGCLHRVAGTVRNRGLIMLFSDLLADPGPVLQGLHHLRHRGHEVIVFHVLDQAEAEFPFAGTVEFADVESPETLTVDARGIKDDYLSAVAEFREQYRKDCAAARIDYVPTHTGVSFDKALLEYLVRRRSRF